MFPSGSCQLKMIMAGNLMTMLKEAFKNNQFLWRSAKELLVNSENFA